MNSVLIDIYDITNTEAGEWRVRFEIELRNCNQGTGDFQYTLNISRSNGSTYTRTRKSVPFTPADGKHFVHTQIESIQEEDTLTEVTNIRPLLFRCDDDRNNRLKSTYPTSYAPYAACQGKSSQGSNKDARTVAAVISMVYELAVAYSIIANDGKPTEFQELLKNITDSLTKTQKLLKSISSKLDILIKELSNLPEKIRGIVDESNLKVQIGEATGYCQLIQDKIRPEFIDSNSDGLAEALDSLQVKIAAISSLRGVSGYLIISPLVAVWLGGSVALERSRIRKDPTYKIDSPWGRSLIAATKAMLLDLLENMDQSNEYLQSDVLPYIPTPTTTKLNGIALPPKEDYSELSNEAHPPTNFYLYNPARPRKKIEISGNHFIEIEYSDKEQAKKGDIIISCDGAASTKLEMVADVGHPLPHPDWIDLNPENITSPRQKQYLEIHNSTSDQMNSAASFYAFAIKLNADRNMHLQTFIEPPLIWLE